MEHRCYKERITFESVQCESYKTYDCLKKVSMDVRRSKHTCHWGVSSLFEDVDITMAVSQYKVRKIQTCRLPSSIQENELQENELPRRT